MTLKAERPSKKKEKLLRAVSEAPPKRLNLDVEAGFYRLMRQRALEEDRSMADITRELWRKYLGIKGSS